MEHITEVFYFSMVIAVLVIALSVGNAGFRQTERLVEIAKDNVDSEPTLYHNRITDREEVKNNELVSCREVIGRMLMDAEVDNMVDNILIEEESHDFYSFDYSKMEPKNYHRKYIRDESGKIMRMEYYSIEGSGKE